MTMTGVRIRHALLAEIKVILQILVRRTQSGSLDATDAALKATQRRGARLADPFQKREELLQEGMMTEEMIGETTAEISEGMIIVMIDSS